MWLDLLVAMLVGGYLVSGIAVNVTLLCERWRSATPAQGDDDLHEMVTGRER